MVQTVAGYTYGGGTSSSSLFIGNSSNDVNEPFSGLIDEVALYSRDITAAEVLEHYQARTAQ